MTARHAGTVLSLWQKPKNSSEARAVARLGSYVLGITAVYSVIRSLMTRPSKSEMLEKMRAVRGPVTMDEAGVDQLLFEQIAEAMVWVSAGLTILSVLIFIGLAVWQWRKPGWIIPMLFLVFVLAGVPAVLSALSNDLFRENLMNPGNLMGWGLNLMLAMVMLAAYRGGRLYHQFKEQQL